MKERCRSDKSPIVAPYVSTALKLQEVSSSNGYTLQGGATTILDNNGMNVRRKHSPAKEDDANAA